MVPPAGFQLCESPRGWKQFFAGGFREFTKSCTRSKWPVTLAFDAQSLGASSRGGFREFLGHVRRGWLRAPPRDGFPEFLSLHSQDLSSRLPAWLVSRLSEWPCTETGLRWQVSRVPEPACRQFATATRETCRQNPETRARRRSNSENPPRGARFAARRPANSENLPTRGVAATATRKTRQARRGPATRTRKTCQLGSGGRSNPENLPAA